MSDQDLSDVHTVIVEIEIDGELYSTVVVTDDVSFWFANSMGQAVTLAIVNHFSEAKVDED